MADLDATQWLDATSQAELVDRGEVSARELVQAAIGRIERLNPDLNAIVSRRFDKALTEADAVDRSPKDRRGPFAGVPFLVKDLRALAGERLTLGSRLFETHVPRKDEPWIDCLRGSGLIALGKTTTPELGLVNTTESKLLGPTHNPWRADVSPGGSSGGAAVAVSSGMVSAASCSDGGGSIRIPASACGIFGLKPSRGRSVVAVRNMPGNCSTLFAYGRSIRDAAKFLEIGDAYRVTRDSSGPKAIGLVQPGGLKPLRVALIMPTVFGTDAHPEVAKAVNDAATVLESLGHHVEEAAWPVNGEELMDHFVRIWASVPARLTRLFPLVRVYARGLKVWRWPSYENAFEPATRALAKYFLDNEKQQPGQIPRALAYQKVSEATFAAFFETYDLMIGPVLRRPHFPLGELDTALPFETLRERMLDNVGYTPLQNFLGLPAMSVPLGTGAEGLPIGVHMVAPFMGEERLLKLAYQLEEAAPWDQRRPGA